MFRKQFWHALHISCVMLLFASTAAIAQKGGKGGGKGGDGDDEMHGGSGNDRMYGNADNDRMLGGAGRDFLNGGSGDDELTGNLNNDVFIFSGAHGNDTIIDFAANAATERLDFTMLGTMNNFAQVSAAMSQVGANVVIQTGASSSITLLNVNMADITAIDFYF